MAETISLQIVATPEASASVLFGLYDTLMAAGRDWESLVTAEPFTPVFEVKFVGPSLDPFPCGSGLYIAPDVVFEDAEPSDIIIVPGLNLSPRERLTPSEHRRALEWLGSRACAGSRGTSACTGAIYLAEIGLLDGVETTTHWAFEELFRRHYPTVRLRLDRDLSFADAAKGVVTSGGATDWQELALFLIANYGSAQRATKAAKIWLMADRGELQAPLPPW